MSLLIQVMYHNRQRRYEAAYSKNEQAKPETKKRIGKWDNRSFSGIDQTRSIPTFRNIIPDRWGIFVLLGIRFAKIVITDRSFFHTNEF